MKRKGEIKKRNEREQKKNFWQWTVHHNRLMSRIIVNFPCLSNV